jgi:hypothetical protein
MSWKGFLKVEKAGFWSENWGDKSNKDVVLGVFLIRCD